MIQIVLIGEIRFMDMLYARYSNPMELMRTYIRRGRFGEFVQGFLQAEHDRRKAEADRDEEWHWWTAYIHSYSDLSFGEWKRKILGQSGSKTTGGDYDLDDKGVQSIIDNIFPGSTTNG